MGNLKKLKVREEKLGVRKENSGGCTIILHSYYVIHFSSQWNYNLPVQIDDPQGTFFKLSQTNVVSEYKVQFKNMTNHIHMVSSQRSNMKLFLSEQIHFLRPSTLQSCIFCCKT